MSKRPPTLTFTDTPSTNAARRKTSKDEGDPKPDVEMLSARVNGVNARQFRALAKLKGGTVQTLLDEAIAQYLERNRV
jgi:hypothetical protein